MRKILFVAAASIISVWGFMMVYVLLSGFYDWPILFNADTVSSILYSSPAYNFCTVMFGLFMAKQYLNIRFQWKPMAAGASLLLLVVVGSVPAVIPFMGKSSLSQAELVSLAAEAQRENRLLTRIVCSNQLNVKDLPFKPTEKSEWDDFEPEITKKCVSSKQQNLANTAPGVNL